MGYAHFVMGLTAVLACLDVPAASSAALSSQRRPDPALELRRPAPVDVPELPQPATIDVPEPRRPATFEVPELPPPVTFEVPELPQLGPVVVPELRRPGPVAVPVPRRLPSPWPGVLAPPPAPFVMARRSRVAAVLPWRRRVAARFDWPDTAAVHGKDVHWPALRRDGFMLHHTEVNRGHHHHTDFGTQPAESGLIDLMIF